MNTTVNDQPPEREPELLVHFNPDTWEQRSPCGLSVGELVWTAVSTNPVDVTCPPCAATLVDGQLADIDVPEVRQAFEPDVAELERQLHHAGAERTNWRDMSDDELEGRLRGSLQAAAAVEPAFPELAPPVGPAEPPVEHRTVGLEVLTEELRALADAERTAEGPEYMKRTGRELLAAARVAVVGRQGAEVAVSVVDTDWSKLRAPLLLARMIQHAAGQADQGGAELLWPGADVLAALSGQPVGRYTAPLELRADQLDVGWLVRDVSKVGAEERVSAVLECEDSTCVCMDCCVVVIDGVEPLHFDSYSRLTVRIPAGEL